MSEASGPPFERPLSEKVRGFYGYKDARVELRVQLPKAFWLIQKEYRENFASDELRKLKNVLDEAVLWADLSKEDRERMGAP